MKCTWRTVKIESTLFKTARISWQFVPLWLIAIPPVMVFETHPDIPQPRETCASTQTSKGQEWGMTILCTSAVGNWQVWSSPLCYSHSLCSYGNKVEHFRVLEGGGQYCIWEESFCSLNRLVDFYRTHSIALDKMVCLRDLSSSPQRQVQSGCNPYPNPYKSCSQESLHTAHLHSHQRREASARLLDAGVRKNTSTS